MRVNNRTRLPGQDKLPGDYFPSLSRPLSFSRVCVRYLDSAEIIPSLSLPTLCGRIIMQLSPPLFLLGIPLSIAERFCYSLRKMIEIIY